MSNVKDTSLTPPLAPEAVSFAARMRSIAALALPIGLSRLGMVLFMTVDTAMIGRHSSQDLAYFGLALATFGVLLLLGIGFMVATSILTAQAQGAGDQESCGLIWRVGFAHGAGLGLLFFILTLAGPWLFYLTGQPQDLAEGASRTLVWMGTGYPPALMQLACMSYLETMGRARPGVAVVIVGNLLNVLLNSLMIDGPLLSWGADGAALATAICRVVMLALLLGYMFRPARRLELQIVGNFAGGARIAQKMWRIGFPLGLAHGLEASAFSALTFFAGLLGGLAVAGHLVAMQLAAFCFMAAVGIGSSAAVHVGRAVGRGDGADIIRSGFAGAVLIFLVMTVLALLVIANPSMVADLFTQDPALLALLLPLLIIVAMTLPGDGLQGVFMSALRGTGDVWLPTMLHLFAFLGVMVPLAGWLSQPALFGLQGLWIATAAGVTTAALILGLRFYIVASRPVARL